MTSHASLCCALALTVVFASLVSVSSRQTCFAKCTCEKNMVVCLDPTLNSFPSPLPVDTEIVQIKGTYSQRFQFQHLSKSDLAGLTSLKHLTISHTSLDSIENGAFDELTSLVTLDLSFNRLTSLPAGILDKLRGLMFLHLTGNEHLNLGPGVFTKLLNLQELYLGDLSLGNLDLRVLSDLDRLVSLDLSGNSLTSVPNGVADPSFLRSLQNLDLSYNELSRLTNDTAPLLRRVSHVWLGNNPWICNCELKWLQEHFRSHIFPSHMSSQVARCEGPDDVASMAMGLLKPNQFICIAPQIVHCDPVEPQTLGATFRIRCNMTGVPFPFVSWKTADGFTTIGSSRHQVSPLLDLRPPAVTITLMAGASTNGTLTVLAQNVYGVGTEKIEVLVKPLPTTTTPPSTTTDKTRPTSGRTTAGEVEGKTGGGVDENKTDEKKNSGGMDGMMMLFIAAGVGGVSLLLSAIMLGVACRKLNKAKVTPLQQQDNNNDRKKKGGKKNNNNDDDDRDYGDDGVDERNYGRGDPNGDSGGRPPTAGRPMSAWDV